MRFDRSFNFLYFWLYGMGFKNCWRYSQIQSESGLFLFFWNLDKTVTYSLQAVCTTKRGGLVLVLLGYPPYSGDLVNNTIYLWILDHFLRSDFTYINDITTSGSMSPFRESKYFLRSWSQCSKTRVSFRSEWRTSCKRTIFLCFSSFNRHISRRAEEGTP